MSEFDAILNDDDETVETTDTETAGVEAVAESPAPEQAEISEPAPVADEAQPITRDDGATWSENAKRWYLNGKIVAGEPPAPSEPSIPSVPAAVAPVTPAPAPVTPAGEPFVVRGGGQKHTIPGATVDADGRVTIAPESVGQIKTLLASGIEFSTNWQREKQTLTQRVQTAESRGKAEASIYNRVAADLFDKVMSDDWLIALAENPQRERDFLRRELALSLEKAKMAIPPAESRPESEPQNIEAAFGHTLNESLDELLDDAPKGLFSAEDVADLKAAYTRRMAAYAAEHEGSVVLDFHTLRDDFAREVKLAQRAQQQASAAQQAAQKAKAAAAFNAANVPKTTAPTPTKPKPTLVPAGTKPSGQKPDWDKSFKGAWTDEDEE